MNVLVACEESQAVTIELRKLGHEAYSCDILECSGGHPEWHIREDVLPLLNGNCSFRTCDCEEHHISGKWDMMIAFPPCTHLAVSGAAHFAKKIADGRQQQGIDFFMKFANADCPRIAIENPIGIMSKKWRKPDQIIQPWWFGDNVGKSTCLWLKGLPLLKPDVTERPPVEYHTWVSKSGKTKRQEMWFYHTRCLPHAQRGKAASKTFPGIARAIAEQWGGRKEGEKMAKNVKDLTREELIEAMRTCAAGDGEACVNCPAGPNHGSDCCAELLTAAADALENA